MKGYHLPQNIHNFVLDSGEYINKVQLYHGTALPSTIDIGVWDMIVGISFYTNRGILNVITARVAKRAKVMFSQASVIL